MEESVVKVESGKYPDETEVPKIKVLLTNSLSPGPKDFDKPKRSLRSLNGIVTIEGTQ